jgi:hypothetical protein
MNCEKLQEVVLSGPIWKIRSSAFTGCKMLQRVILPESLLKIGKYAFSWCVNLREITFPRNLQIICEYAFSNCRNLENVIFPEDSVCQIHEKSFNECDKLNPSNRFIEKLYGELTPDENRFEQEHCSISGDEFEETMPIILLKCGHFFKRESLLDWLKIKSICPLCKIDLLF